MIPQYSEHLNLTFTDDHGGFQSAECAEMESCNRSLGDWLLHIENALS
jgi:hypothetical protein